MNPVFTIELQQHTPIIHFQHHQDGATLRATEVKAKLDKFIWENFDFINSDLSLNQNKKELFNPEDKPGSLYKVSVTTSANQWKILLSTNLNKEQKDALNRGNVRFIDSAPYFAMEESIRNDLFEKTGIKVRRYPRDKDRDELRLVDDFESKVSHWGVMTPPDSKIKVSFFSFDSDVLKILSKSVHAFFGVHNFGTRQSKGFGSFTVLYPKSNKSFVELVTPFYSYRYQLDKHFNHSNSITKLQQQFNRIQDDDRLIKSGRPAKMRGGYRKAQTFLYGLQQNEQYRWSKRYIKRGINNNKVKVREKVANLKVDGKNSAIFDSSGTNTWNDPPNTKYCYIRALLGLAEQYEFQTDKGYNNKYKVLVDGGEYKRYSSPLIWKIIGGNVYLLANQVDENLLNKPFKFKIKLGSESHTLHAINTPEEFDLGDFLDFVFDSSPEVISGYSLF